jgi:hypothetical protein
MTTVLLAVGAAAALACPAHMLWRMRRGDGPTCGDGPYRKAGVDAARRRQRDLEAPIDELATRANEADPSCAPTVRG